MAHASPSYGDDSPTVAVLQARIAALEAQNSALTRTLAMHQNTSTQCHNLQKQLRVFQTLVQNAPDGIGVADLKGTLMYANTAYQQMIGYGSDLIGQTIFETYDETPERLQHLVQQVMLHGEWRGTLNYKRKDGRTFPGQLSALCIRDQRGEPQAVAGIFRDVTEQQRAEQTLHRANVQLAQAARLKDEFLSNMSHELRTPLNAIIGRVEALQEGFYGELTDRQISALRTTTEHSYQLLGLINNILDLAKIDADKEHLHPSPIQVDEVCRVCLQSIVPEAEAKQIKVIEAYADTICEFSADRRRLKQMLTNLLSNAVKFTSPGGTIGLEVRNNPENQMLEFLVWDTGIGIAQNDVEHLFEPFSQIDSSLARQYQGSGLGLALVSRLAKMHGGYISVESHDGSGSCFTLSLPQAQWLQ